LDDRYIKHLELESVSLYKEKEIVRIEHLLNDYLGIISYSGASYEKKEFQLSVLDAKSPKEILDIFRRLK